MYPIENVGVTKVTKNNCSNWSLSRIHRLEQNPHGAHHLEFEENTELLCGIIESYACIRDYGRSTHLCNYI